MFPIRLLLAGAIAVGGASSAHAQGCDTPGGCGPAPVFGTGALFAPNKNHARYPDANYPLCATKAYPLSDWKFISKYCGPTLNPGTCYGYYPTKWRRWEEICPQGGEAGCAATMPAPSGIPQVITPVLPAPTPLPTPIPPATDKIPKVDFLPEAAPTSVAPGPLPMIPMPKISSTPVLPVSPAEHGKPAPDAPLPPLKTLPNLVVPPLKELPERSRN